MADAGSRGNEPVSGSDICDLSVWAEDAAGDISIFAGLCVLVIIYSNKSKDIYIYICAAGVVTDN